MKIVLSGKGTINRQGDAMALAGLLHFLNKHKDNEQDLDKWHSLVLHLWIYYLEGIEESLMAANYRQVAAKDSFNLPFEKDFTELWGEEERT